MLEAIENNWDDILHEALQYPLDTFGRDALQSYELDLEASLWGSQSRRNNPLAVLGSIGTIPPFETYSSNSTNSSPMLSDDYPYPAEDVRKQSITGLSSEGTISPKDSVLMSPYLSETVGYYSFPSAPDQSRPDIHGPASPVVAARPTEIAHIKRHRDAHVPQPGGPLRRRSTKLNNLASSNPGGNKSASPVSNNNNSKPMTARDRKRRQMHNASAMRSRIRLNETLDKMWKTIPSSRRRRRSPSVGLEGGDPNNEQLDELDEDEEERIGRADKVEVGIEYIMYLETRVKELEEQLSEIR